MKKMIKLHNLLKPVVNSKEKNLNRNKKYFGNIWLWFTCLLFFISFFSCSPSTTSDDGGGDQPDLIDLGLQLTEFQINGKDKDESVSLLVGRDLNITIQVTNQSINDYDGIVTYYQSGDNEITTNDNSLASTNVSLLTGGGSWEATFTPAAPSSAGTYYYGACLSFENEVKVNQVTCTDAVQVDIRELDLGLALTGFQINRQGKDETVSLLVGRDLTMAVEVANQGNNEYTGTVTYYQSGDNEITTNDNSLASTNVFLLTGGGSWEATFTPATPSSAGTYYYGACLSFENEVKVNQVTCTDAVQVDIRELDLGLALTGFQINRQGKDETVSLLAGRDLTMAVEVANQGNNEYTGMVTYYQSGDNEITTNDNSLASTNVSLLTGGGSWKATFTQVAPINVGTYYYGACLSFQDQENVNQVTCTATVQVVVRELDLGLALTGFQVNEVGKDEIVSLLAGRDLNIAFEVTNQGKNEYTGMVTYYQSGDDEITTNDNSLSSDNVPLLTEGGSWEATFAQVAPINVGTYYYGACLSFENEVKVNQVTCTDAIQVMVLELGLALTSFQLNGKDDSAMVSLNIAGMDLTMAVEVTNQGKNNYDGTVTYYQSKDNTISTEDTSLYSAPTFSLVEGASWDKTIIRVAPSLVGTYYYGACLSFEDEVKNNQVTCTAAVQLVVQQKFLENVANVGDSDNSDFKLAGVRTISIIKEDRVNPSLFVGGYTDNVVSVFSLSIRSARSLSVYYDYNIDDGDNPNFKLAGASSITAAEVGETNYLFVAGRNDNGVSVFSLFPPTYDPLRMNGLKNIDNIDDHDNILKMRGVNSITTAKVGDHTYLFAAGENDNGVSVFRVNSDGGENQGRLRTLGHGYNDVDNVADDDTLELRGASSVTTAKVWGGVTYLFVAGRADNGVSMFRVESSGSLINVDNVADDGTLKLAGASSVTTAVVRNITYLFVAGENDNGVSVFRLDPTNGKLDNVANIADDDTLELAGASSVTTAEVGGNTYLFVAGKDDNGVSVFRANSSGGRFILNNVYNVDDDDTLNLAGASSVTTAEVGGNTYLFVAGRIDNGVSVFRVKEE